MRIQRLAEAPDTEKLLAVLPSGPARRPHGLVRTATTIEQVRTDGRRTRWAPLGRGGDLRGIHALRASSNMEDPSTIAPIVDTLTRWVSSTLVLAGRPPLHFPAGRGGRGLTPTSARRAPTSAPILVLGGERFVDATAPNLGGKLDPISWILGTSVPASRLVMRAGLPAPLASSLQPSSASP